jgi:carotenoid 1,2-hydratase
MHRQGPRFDVALPSGGYAWWYIDALSDDGSQGLTLIAFIGSVFSPYYAWARRRGQPDPANHCAFNVALYGRRDSRWTMTERGSARLQREATALGIGPSVMRWTGDALEIEIDERGAPLPRPVRGTIRLHPSALTERSFPLDHRGRHHWTPYAPCARVEVELSRPALRWSGPGYFDSNIGLEPLEHTFTEWTWSRASVAGSTVVLYDVGSRDPAHRPSDASRSLALSFAANGAATQIAAPPPVRLPTTGWRVPRWTRADEGTEVRVVDTLEDAPFYSRTLLDTCLLGRRRPAFHESLDLDRFRSPWVQCLLPFRMPRLAR